MSLLNIFSKILRSANEKIIDSLKEVIVKINSLEAQYQQMTDFQLAEKTDEFKKRLQTGETLEEILPEAFAVVREAARRTVNMRHFDVQLMGGIILHQGKIAEMATGEGKTLVATLSAYLNALTGKSVHIVTVNDYLAKRDSEWMGPIYKFLGLTVGLIQHDYDYQQRQQAYECAVVYGTNNEFGFDYLRDNMAFHPGQCVQKLLNYAIVDEVDSILIDEARTPLIISGMVEESTENYRRLARLSRTLEKDKDFTLDEKTRNVIMTEEGLKKAERGLNVESLYDLKHMDLAHMLVQSIRALHLYKKDVDYVIKDGEIVIVDEFTGRLMIGRRYSEGLHQAIEAKENVRVKEESQTLASITFQNYFRMYQKLAGMTGTAATEAAEFEKIYNLEVVTIPTNKSLIRTSYPDVIYKTKKEKYQAVIREITELFKIGRPVLVGTISIEVSEKLSEMLTRLGIPHNVLNAKYHEKEAQIVAKAGQKNTVTIATNMAGRGTDIVLGEGIPQLGGLHIIGTERHEARRIDNQLRGRAGRQGDPGSSRFYISLEDDLMRLFGSERIAGIMERLGLPENTPIEHPLITGAIERAQKKVEQYHFSIRKQVLEYDDVMNRQRQVIYALRRQILEGQNLKEKIAEHLSAVSQRLAEIFSQNSSQPADWDLKGLEEELKNFSVVPDDSWQQEVLQLKNKTQLQEKIAGLIASGLARKEKEIGPTDLAYITQQVMLRIIDTKWIDHLHDIDILREGIGLRAYGQKDPLIEYKIEGYELFKQLMESFQRETLELILKIQVVRETAEPSLHLRGVHYSGQEENLPPPAAPMVAKKEKIGRNQPCPCGSGKKYKKCCGQSVAV
jgi:preprotein translocase subunit SecA